MKTYNQFINEGIKQHIKNVLRKPVSHFKRNKKKYFIALTSLVAVGTAIVFSQVPNKDIEKLKAALNNINTVIGGVEEYNNDIDEISKNIEDNIKEAERLIKSINKNIDYDLIIKP